MTDPLRVKTIKPALKISQNRLNLNTVVFCTKVKTASIYLSFNYSEIFCNNFMFYYVLVIFAL